MQQESSQELLGGNCHQPLLVLMGIIFPAEGDLAISNVYDPVVGDGDAMRAAGQIVEDMFGSSEWSFGVDYPVMAKQRSQKCKKSFLLGKPFDTGAEPEFALEESALQTGDELTAKDAAQYLNRQEKRIPFRSLKGRFTGLLSLENDIAGMKRAAAIAQTGGHPERERNPVYTLNHLRMAERSHPVPCRTADARSESSTSSR